MNGRISTLSTLGYASKTAEQDLQAAIAMGQYDQDDTTSVIVSKTEFPEL